VRELTEKLFDTRGESVVLNAELKSRKEQVSDLEQRVARLKAQLASVEKQSNEIAQSKIVEEVQLRLALQVLTEEMERLVPQDSVKNQLIGGVPVDSEYVIFVIDTSGSMQMAAWRRVQTEMMNILDIYPAVKGIQVMNDMGQYMFTDTRRAWMRDSPATRRRIISALDSWAPFSNSSPVEGITAVQGLAVRARDQHGAPATGPRIPPAGAVGIDLNCLGQGGFYWSRRIRDTRVDGSASPATTFGFARHTGRTGVNVLMRFCAESI
jgi:hypothetical protein